MIGRAVLVVSYIILGTLRLGFRLASNRFARRGESGASIIGRTLAEVFEALGPTYIKLGQILSTRRDLLSEPVIRHLERLQDRLPAIPFRLVPPLFRREFGIDLAEAFTAFERSPIASASIASVYRGRLPDGRVVAVKIRRPGIERRIAADLRLLRAATGLCGLLPWFRLLPLRPAVNEFGTCLVRQLDFRLEAAANRRLGAALAWEQGVIVPELVEELCSSSILTMEFIEGLQLPAEPSRRRARQALLAGLHALYRMIFVEGLIHCDMHQGNLHFLPDGRAALVDFGFMAEFARADRLKFAEFFYTMATNDGVRCAQITLETAASYPPDLAYDAFEADVIALVNRAAGARAREFQVADFVLSLFDLQRRYRVLGTTAFTMAIVSLLVFEGIAKDTYADLDFQREAYPFILRASIRPHRPEPGRLPRREAAPAYPDSAV